MPLVSKPFKKKIKKNDTPTKFKQGNTDLYKSEPLSGKDTLAPPSCCILWHHPSPHAALCVHYCCGHLPLLPSVTLTFWPLGWPWPAGQHTTAVGGLKLAVTLVDVLLVLSVQFFSGGDLLDASWDLKRFSAVYGTCPVLKRYTGVAQVGVLECDHLEACKRKGSLVVICIHT